MSAEDFMDGAGKVDKMASRMKPRKFEENSIWKKMSLWVFIRVCYWSIHKLLAKVYAQSCGEKKKFGRRVKVLKCDNPDVIKNDSNYECNF